MDARTDGKERRGAILSEGSATRMERIPVVSPAAIAGASASLLEEAGQAAPPMKVQARTRAGAWEMAAVMTGMRRIRKNFVVVRVARLAALATSVENGVVVTVSEVGNEDHDLVDVRVATQVPVTKIAGPTSVPTSRSPFTPKMPVSPLWRKQSVVPAAPSNFLISQKR